jgi:hypothetical protein
MDPFSRKAQNEIAHFRGLPPNRSKAIERPAVPLDDLFNIVFEEHRINQPNFHQVLMEHWKQIVGPGNAHRCSPVRVAEPGILIVAAPNSTFRQELIFQKPYFLGEIQKLPGGERIRELRFISG